MNAISHITRQKTGLKIIRHLDQANKQNHKRFPYLFGILNPLEVNKGETTGATRALVVHHVDPRQRSVARKHLPQVTLCSVQAQAKHPQTCAGVGVRLEGSNMRVKIDGLAYRIYPVIYIQNPFTGFSMQNMLLHAHSSIYMFDALGTDCRGSSFQNLSTENDTAPREYRGLIN